jgi:hypothetical protein
VSSTGRSSRRRWRTLGDAELLELPIDSLGLRSNHGTLGPRIDGLMADLKRCEIRLRPHVWLSTDWFSPDGVPGIALPFYLGDPRLVKLERTQMLWAEGSTAKECTALLRHEAGHAVDTAFHLSRRAIYRQTFGKRSETYRRRYVVEPRSQDFVQHLDRWYAQSHPAEDFAETFAVWLGSRGRWRARYGGTEAGRKLEVLDELMDSIRGERASVSSREECEPVGKLGITLGEHYRARRRKHRREATPPFDSALQKNFHPGRPWIRNAKAAQLLQRDRKSLAQQAAEALNCDAYTCDQVIGWMIQHARELGLGEPLQSGAFALDTLIPMIRSTLRALARGGTKLSR